MLLLAAALLSGCGNAAPVATPRATPAETEGAAQSVSTTPGPTPTAWHFPAEVFAALGDGPVSDELGAALQAVLEASTDGAGLTATVIGPAGVWSGATGMATAERAMVPSDQMSIAHVTHGMVAAQVLQLVEAGRLKLDDLAAEHLPPDLRFDLNGETIADLLSHRSGFRSDTFPRPRDEESITNDPARSWTIEEILGTVGSERGPVGAYSYRGVNYLLLGLVIQQVTGQSVGEAMRHGVLAGDGYARLIYQPDERPTEPMSMPLGASSGTFEANGGYLPSLSFVTAFRAEKAMASDSPSLARWFRSLCAGEVISQASLDEMTDFAKRPDFALGFSDRRGAERDSAAPGLTGSAMGAYRSAALCYANPGVVVVVLANGDADVEALAEHLWRAAS